MEPGRMPLPTAWHPVPDVGAARGQGSGSAACTHSQIYSMLWRGQSEYRKIHTRNVRQVRRNHFRECPKATPTASLAWQANGDSPGQRQVPPRRTSQTLASEISGRAQSAVPAALQSATRSYRASLEVGPPFGHTQQILCHFGRTTHRSRTVLRPLATIQRNAA